MEDKQAAPSFAPREVPMDHSGLQQLLPVLSGKVNTVLAKKGSWTDSELSERTIQIFTLVDSDGSGSISSHEVKHLMKLLGEEVDLAEIDQMIAEFDLDKSGEVDVTEFIAMMAMQRKSLAEYNKKDMLRAFDLLAQKTHSRQGTLNKNALTQILQQYGSSVASAKEITKLVETLPVCEGSDTDFDYVKHIKQMLA